MSPDPSGAGSCRLTERHNPAKSCRAARLRASSEATNCALAGRAGAAYRTETQLELRKAHAAARDSVRAELDIESTFGTALIEELGLFDAYTEAADKNEYLLRPDLGRRFSAASRTKILQCCSSVNDLQIAVGMAYPLPLYAPRFLNYSRCFTRNPWPVAGA